MYVHCDASTSRPRSGIRGQGRVSVSRRLRDAQSLVADGIAAGVEATAPVAVSYHVRFLDRSAWESAAAAAAPAWEVSAYSKPGAHMLMLTTNARLIESDLDELRARALAFSDECVGVCEWVTVDPLAMPSAWHLLANAPDSSAESLPEVPSRSNAAATKTGGGEVA